jgi:hypothetical protein
MKKPGSREKKPGFSALGGTRTPNLLIRSQMLYPLSYKREEKKMKSSFQSFSTSDLPSPLGRGQTHISVALVGETLVTSLPRQL